MPVEEFSQNVTQFFEDNDGRLFLNMNVHLCEYDRENDRFVSRIHAFDPYRQFNSTCYVDRKNRIWVVNPSLLRSYNAATMERTDSIPLHGYYSASVLDPDGRLWLGAEGHIRIFDVNLHRFIDTPEVLTDNHRLKGKTISRLHLYDNKIVGVCDKHLFVYDKGRDTVVFDDEINFPFKSPGFNISTIYNDREGNVWFGSEDQGYSVVYRYHDRFSNHLSSFFKNKSIVSIAGADNTLVFLTLDKEIYLYNQTENGRPTLASPLPEGCKVYSLKADNDGYIWLMTPDKSYKTRVTDSGLKIEGEYNMFLPVSLAQDRNGTVWISTYTEQLHALRKGASEFTSIGIRPKTFTFTSDLHALQDGRIIAITFDYPLLFVNPDNWSVVQSKVGYGNVSIPILTSKFTPTCLFQDNRAAYG